MPQLPRSFVDDIIAHAHEEKPNECCGIIAGRGGEAVKLYRTTNAERSPYRYNVEPRELLKITREIDANDWDVWAIYHSHLETEARPSPTDVRLATNWPDPYYLVVSLQDDEPVLKAWRIVGDDAVEEPLEVA